MASEVLAECKEKKRPLRNGRPREFIDVKKLIRLGIAAAIGATIMGLSFIGNAAAFALGYSNLGSRSLSVALWPLVIFIPLFDRLGFESIWFPHPFAFLASFAIAISVYSLAAYCVLWLVAKARSSLSRKHPLS